MVSNPPSLPDCCKVLPSLIRPCRGIPEDEARFQVRPVRLRLAVEQVPVEACHPCQLNATVLLLPGLLHVVARDTIHGAVYDVKHLCFLCISYVWSHSAKAFLLNIFPHHASPSPPLPSHCLVNPSSPSFPFLLLTYGWSSPTNANEINAVFATVKHAYDQIFMTPFNEVYD